MLMEIDFTAPSGNLLPIFNNHHYQVILLFDLNPVQQNINSYPLHSQWRQVSVPLNSFFRFFKKVFLEATVQLSLLPGKQLLLF